MACLRRAHGRRLGPHALRELGRRAPHRRLPAGHRARPDGRPADRPLLAAPRHGRGRHRALRRLLRASVCEQRRTDRGFRRSRRLRDRFLPACRLRRAAEPRQGRGAAERPGSHAGRRRPDDRPRPTHWRCSRRRHEPRLGVRDQRGHVPLLGRADPSHPAPSAAGGPGRDAGALARRGRGPQAHPRLPRPADGAHRLERGHARQRGRERRRGGARQGLVRRRRLRLRPDARQRRLRPRLREPERGLRGSSIGTSRACTARASH